MAMTSTPQALRHGFQLNEYTIRDVVGMGGFGVVYRAWDCQLEREVAIKEYLPCALAHRAVDDQVKVLAPKHQALFDAGMRSFINEARLLAQFDHPALVKVYRFWEAHGTAYMVMPLYHGVPLKTWWSSVPLTAREAELKRLITVLCSALDMLHQQQCFHRDISPDNILVLNNTGQPVLLDFGAARRQIGSSTQAFTVVLKASYAPIEQYAEDPDLQQGPWTDIYALGAVMHDLMAGKPPPSAVTRMIQDPYQPLTDQTCLYSAELCDCVNQCLQLLPAQRPQHVQDLQMKLSNMQDSPGSAGEPTQILPKRPYQKPSHGKKIHPLLSTRVTAIVGTALFSTVGLLTSIDWGMREQKAQGSVSNQIQAAVSNPVQRLDVDALIEVAWRTVQQQGGFQPLQLNAPNPVLKIGRDLLSVEVNTPQSGWLSVYALTTGGQFIRLFPNRRFSELRATAGKTLVFPPTAEPIQSTGPAGTNRLWFVVSHRPPVDTDLHWTDQAGYDQLTLNVYQNRSDGGLLLGQQLLRAVGCGSNSCTDIGAIGTLRIEEVE
ncbi:serine/threonine-protein kinase [Limnobacter humi]|uniref:Serine/threonine-protein kinase n=1 Tax=Limnobacter humi TaxID=1778671 RepID=A0ABT1WD66_9BURK|nr:serine/threonine-protein kinase [Limnobacter humi]MCQ8895468.1 serine/threonine-protein kinase [Limnobacter humi]